MADLVDDCPRCGAEEITFDVLSDLVVEVLHGWQRWYEVFSVCRRCHRSTVFLCSLKEPDRADDFKRLARLSNVLNDVVTVERPVSLQDADAEEPPEYLSPAVEAAYNEAAQCFAVGCYNAAGVMFRLCLDLATAPLLPEGDANGLNAKVRRDLGLRLPWMFEQKLLPKDLQGLSTCVKDDGNDGAHRGTLTRPDAEDLQDFTFEVLERLFTEPKRVELAEERRKQRRSKPA